MQDEDPYRCPSEIDPETRGNPFRAVRPREHGLRAWMAVNHDLAVVLCLIAAYASMMLYFVALVAFGRETLASRTLVVLVVVFGILAWILIRSSLQRPRLKRTRGGWRWRLRPSPVWTLYRPVKTERIEKWIAAVLWSFIAVVAVALLLWYRRHSQ
jgi:hypothetical protein